MDVRAYNREAWDREVAKDNPWTRPVSQKEVEAARLGEWSVVLTPRKPVPREWFGPGGVAGKDVLGLASAGGQQCPLFAAAGARVTVFDNSPAQLARDREVAERDGLAMRFEEGDMRDLSRFPDESFDLVFHAASNLFVPDVRPVWREAARVLRPGGRLLSGFCNPVMFLFDRESADRGELVLAYRAPYSDLTSQPPETLQKWIEKGEPLEFGHTLEDQIGGQTDAGLVVAGFFEDSWGVEDSAMDRLMPMFIATLARKPPV